LATILNVNGDDSITVPGVVTVRAEDSSSIIAGAGAAAIASSDSSGSSGGSGAVGGAFAINSIGTDADPVTGEGANLIWAEIDNSRVLADGDITISADVLAQILAVGIGAAGSVTSTSDSGAGLAASISGSIGVNKIRNDSRARAKNGSFLTSNNGKIRVATSDDSLIESVAGAANLSIASTQGSGAAVGLGISLTINDIENTTQALIENTSIDAFGAVEVEAISTAVIRSLGFGISVSVAISEDASAVAANATGALSFNEIDKSIEAAIRNSDPPGTATLISSSVSITADDQSLIEAISVAAGVSVSGATSATAVSISIGLALAHNRIATDVTASIVNMPTVDTTRSGVINGGDVVVSATDDASIDVVSFAAAVSVAIGKTAVGVAGGASESTNIILSRTNAFIENSNIGAATEKVGNVDLDAVSTSKINALVAGIAASVAASTSGGAAVAVAIGIGVARNFIGWDPNGGAVSGSVIDASGAGRLQQSLTPGMQVHIDGGPLEGDIYRYIGPTVTANDPDTPELELFDLMSQQYRDAELWEHVNAASNAAQVRAYLLNSSVNATGALTIDAVVSGQIDAIVIAAAVGVAAGSGVSVGVSGAGVYAENKIKTDVKAFIEGDGDNTASDGINVASASLSARDASGIESIAAAASLSAAIGGTVGVAVSIGLSLSFNEVSNAVEAYISNADEGVFTGRGNVAISAIAQNQPNPSVDDLDLADTGIAGIDITPEKLDDAAIQDSDHPNDPTKSGGSADYFDNPTDDTANEERADLLADRDILLDMP
jgi:hypothetical protein